MLTRNYIAAPDPTEGHLWAVRYEIEYEPGEWASVWFARELSKVDAEEVAKFAELLRGRKEGKEKFDALYKRMYLSGRESQGKQREDE